MKHSKRILLSLNITALFLFAHCAGLTHHRNEEALQKVKKVAIVAFAVQAPASNEIGLNFNSGKVGAHEGGSMIHKSTADIDEMYNTVVKAFGKNTGWTVVPVANMKQNAGYKKAFDDTMKGWQNKMPTGKGMQQYVVKDIMDGDSVRILGKEGRDALMKALGVDAIVTAKVDVLINSTTVMGFGNRYPQSRLAISLFTPGSNSPDWFDSNLLGEESKTSLGATGFFDESTLTQLALESTKTAAAKIGKKVN